VVPDAVVFEATIARPQSLYEAVRQGLGESGRALPKHYPLLLTELLGASPVLTGRFDMNAPARAVIALDGERFSWLVGLRVHSGAEFVAELTTGAGAPYQAAPHQGCVGLTRPGVKEFPARGVGANWLLLASDDDALGALGEYVSRARFDGAPAQAASVSLRSRGAVGQRLATFWNAWWASSGATLKHQLLVEAGPGATAPVAVHLAALADLVANGTGQLLLSTTGSDITLEVKGAHVVLDAHQAGTLPWALASDACRVASSSPLANPIGAFVWGVSGRHALPLLEASAETLEITAPMFFGIAQAESGTTAFAELGSPLGEQSLAAEFDGAFLAWAPPGAATSHGWQVVKPRGRAAGHWIFSRSAAARLSRPVRSAELPPSEASPSFDVVLGASAGRARWVIGPNAADALASWQRESSDVQLSSGAQLPWGQHCAQLVAGAMLGSVESRIGMWASAVDGGYRVSATAPLRLLSEL
jgi:hypothetical protein